MNCVWPWLLISGQLMCVLRENESQLEKSIEWANISGASGDFFNY